MLLALALLLPTSYATPRVEIFPATVDTLQVRLYNNKPVLLDAPRLFLMRASALEQPNQVAIATLVDESNGAISVYRAEEMGCDATRRGASGLPFVAPDFLPQSTSLGQCILDHFTTLQPAVTRLENGVTLLHISQSHLFESPRPFAVIPPGLGDSFLSRAVLDSFSWEFSMAQPSLGWSFRWTTRARNSRGAAQISTDADHQVRQQLRLDGLEESAIARVPRNGSEPDISPVPI